MEGISIGFKKSKLSMANLILNQNDKSSQAVLPSKGNTFFINWNQEGGLNSPSPNITDNNKKEKKIEKPL